MISTATAAVKASSAGWSGDEPAGERDDREHEHDRHEDRRDPVGQPLHLGLAGLGLLDEAGDAGQRGVGADARGAHDQPAAGVDGGAGDGVARPDLDGHGLAGEHRRVDGRGAVLDDAVGGDLLAGADDEPHARAQLVDRRPALARRRRGSPRPWRRGRGARRARRPSAAWPWPRGSARRRGTWSPRRPPRGRARRCRRRRRPSPSSCRSPRPRPRTARRRTIRRRPARRC